MEKKEKGKEKKKKRVDHDTMARNYNGSIRKRKKEKKQKKWAFFLFFVSIIQVWTRVKC